MLLKELVIIIIRFGENNVLRQKIYKYIDFGGRWPGNIASISILAFYS